MLVAFALDDRRPRRRLSLLFALFDEVQDVAKRLFELDCALSARLRATGCNAAGELVGFALRLRRFHLRPVAEKVLRRGTFAARHPLGVVGPCDAPLANSELEPAAVGVNTAIAAGFGSELDQRFDCAVVR